MKIFAYLSPIIISIIIMFNRDWQIMLPHFYDILEFDNKCIGISNNQYTSLKILKYAEKINDVSVKTGLQLSSLLDLSINSYLTKDFTSLKEYSKEFKEILKRYESTLTGYSEKEFYKSSKRRCENYYDYYYQFKKGNLCIDTIFEDKENIFNFLLINDNFFNKEILFKKMFYEKMESYL